MSSGREIVGFFFLFEMRSKEFIFSTLNKIQWKYSKSHLDDNIQPEMQRRGLDPACGPKSLKATKI